MITAHRFCFHKKIIQLDLAALIASLIVYLTTGDLAKNNGLLLNPMPLTASAKKSCAFFVTDFRFCRRHIKTVSRLIRLR